MHFKKQVAISLWWVVAVFFSNGMTNIKQPPMSAIQTTILFTCFKLWCFTPTWFVNVIATEHYYVNYTVYANFKIKAEEQKLEKNLHLQLPLGNCECHLYHSNTCTISLRPPQYSSNFKQAICTHYGDITYLQWPWR